MKTIPPGARHAVVLCALLFPAVLLGDGSDNFNDNSKDASKWGADIVTGHGVLTEAGQRLRYTCSNGTAEDYVDRPWIATRFPFDADWEVQVDCFNNSSPVAPLQVNSMGIVLGSPLSGDTDLYLELYNSAIGFGSTARTGFFTEMTVEDVSAATEDSGEQFIAAGAIRLSWDSATKVLTCHYDTDPTNGYQWTPLTTYGLAGAGGTHNSDWGLTATDRFFLYLFGYSSSMNVSAGQMALDNFSETGGVSSSGGARPEPTGTFQFPFPTGNALLTRIASLAGNYQGISPVVPQRGYNLDVAQDESGKIMGMGTVTGVQDSRGNSDLAMSLGRVRTVNEEPVAEVKSSFKGNADGVDATFKSNGRFPVELVGVTPPSIVAAGTAGPAPLGVAGTATYSGKANGIPFSGKNEPLEFEAPPGAENNLVQDWSLGLEISVTQVNGKDRIVAAATLVLPDGSTVVFPPKTVKYSEAKGYNLAFKKGTNVTAEPDVIDKKTSIALKGLKFQRQGNDWIPTAGTITYGFLGQKGVEDLLQFVAP